jgi:hypothetical protein
MVLLSLLALAGTALAWPLAFPQGIMDSIMGPAQTGVFGSGAATAAPSLSLGGLVGMLGVVGMSDDTTGGSGPYKSSFGALPDLARHTLYQPKTHPTDQKLPVILWGTHGALSYQD